MPDPTTISAIADVLMLVLAAVGLTFGLLEQRQQGRDRRARWLADLAREYYANESHQRIRALIDYSDQPGRADDWRELTQAIARGGEGERTGAFSRS